MRKDKNNILLEDYTNLQMIGAGGYATVYKVRHNELEYVRAIKVLNAPITSEDDETYKKFLKECRLLLRMGNGNHPNIVHIFQPLFRSNFAFVEMDYVTGEDIKHFVDRVKFVPIENVVQFVKEIGSALAYCHVDIYKYCYDRELDELKDDPSDGSKVLIDDKTRNRLINKYRVIHNDIHSGNIMRTDTGHYVLLDFGLAIQDGEVSRKSQRTNGAPEYKAPEKDNDVISTQSDIYSFGVVLYELLTGHVPFVYNKSVSSVEAEYELLKAHKTRTPAPIIREREKCYQETYNGKAYKNDLPKWLIECVDKCLRKNPKERFEDGKALIEFIDKKNCMIDLPDQIRKLEEQVSNLSFERDRLLKEKKELLERLKNLNGETPPPPNEKEGFRLLREKSYEQAKRIFNLRDDSHMESVCNTLISLEQQKNNGTISNVQQKRLFRLYKEYGIMNIN